MKIIKTRTGEFFIDKNAILHAIMFKGVLVDYEDALDNFLVIKNLTNNTPCVKLIDVSNSPRIDSKAKKFLENKELQTMTKARAILTSNRVKKVSFNFFLQFNSAKVPTKFFIDYDEAINWLKEYL